MTLRTIAIVALIVASSWVAPSARAQPVRVDLGDRQTMQTFRHHEGGTTTFTGDTMHIETRGFEEWAFGGRLWRRWRTRVERSRGWAVEARVRVNHAVPAGCDGSIGIWIYDGSRVLKLAIGAESAGLSYPVSDMRPATTTDGFHVYRVEAKDDWVRVRQDGRELLFVQGPQVLLDGGSQTLMFGDLGGCEQSSADWDWIAFDTSPQLEEPPCQDCVPGADALLLEMRRTLAPALPAQARGRLSQMQLEDTEGADRTCAARLAADLWVRELLPRVYDALGNPRRADEFRQLSSLRAPGGLSAALTLLERAARPPMRQMPGCDPVPGGGPDQCRPGRRGQPFGASSASLSSTIQALRALRGSPATRSTAAQTLRFLARALVLAQPEATIHRGTVWLYRRLVRAQRDGSCAAR